jgi:hypothetical protein
LAPAGAVTLSHVKASAEFGASAVLKANAKTKAAA